VHGEAIAYLDSQEAHDRMSRDMEEQCVDESDWPCTLY
jgi:hypothetical protein